VRTKRYSVPARLIGRRVRVLLHASHVDIYHGHTEVAHHERLRASWVVRAGPEPRDGLGGCRQPGEVLDPGP